jgi:putative tryptophan/tyrosine transport system substrate-binding protein
MRAIAAAALIACLASLAIPLAGEAQNARNPARIAYIRAERPPAADLDAFRQGLREQGYVEGKNIVVEYRWADGDERRLPAIVADLVRLKVDLIVSAAPAATRAAKEGAPNVPIVMVLVADPVAFKFVASLARPGGNVTGFAFLLPELSGKRLELLKQAVPGLSRVAVLWYAANPYKAFDLKEVEAVAARLNVAVQPLPVNGPGDFEAAFEAAAKRGAGGLITLDDPFTIIHRVRIVDLALKHRLPAVYGVEPLSEAGGLMFYGPDRRDQNRRAGIYVDKILRGAKPAELPVERPDKYDLVVNLKTAQAIGIAIPQSLLLRANRIIR